MSDIQDILSRNEEIMNSLERLDGIDEFEVLSYVRDRELTRFANNVVHQQIGHRMLQSRIRVIQGKKLVTLNVSNNFGEHHVEEISKLLRIAPERSYLQGFIDRQNYSQVNAIGKVLSPDEKVELIHQVVGISEECSVKSFGKVETLTFHFAVQNSRGVEGHHSLNYNDIKVLAIAEENGKKGYGREVVTTRAPGKIDIEELTRTAVIISKDTLRAEKIEVGSYEVILRPQACEELVTYSLFGLDGASYHQGDSAYSDRLGEHLFSENLTVQDLPLDGRTVLASPIDGEGHAKRNQVIIDRGVPKLTFFNSMTASQYLGDKTLSTGHELLPYSDYEFGGGPRNIVIMEGDSTEDEMIEDTKLGLIVQTFWYSNPVNGPKGVITGLTRDGLYLVKNGEVKGAVRNMRYTDSFLEFFKGVQYISRDQRSLLYSLSPTIKLESLRFTGQSMH